MMPLALFRSQTFARANLLTFFLYGALSGLMFFLSFNLIQVQGYSAERTVRVAVDRRPRTACKITARVYDKGGIKWQLVANI
jgi:hypothetical protein